MDGKVMNGNEKMDGGNENIYKNLIFTLKRQSCDYAFGWSNCGHDAVHQLAGQF
jgi:hypothetical protein